MMNNPIHVLVLDDDEGLLHLSRKALARMGYRVTVAASAAAAHLAVKQECPDLLVVDYDLKSDTTGLDFFRDVRRDHSNISAIMVTGFADQSRVIEALRAGIVDVLPKSADYLEYLPEAVARVLEQIVMRKRLNEAEMLRDREQYYRNLAEAIPQLVWTCQPNGSCDFLSKQWVDYTGISEQEQLGNAWLGNVLHPDDRLRSEGAWLDAIAGTAEYDLEYRLRRHDGVYRWFKARGVPVRDGDGRIAKWFGTSTDIEDRKQIEQDREMLLGSERVARSEAERAVRIKDEFVATLSHELRTPLNSIVGWAQFLLRDRSDPEKLRKGLEVIDRNARLQAQMVDDLLDMSRIMSGKLRLDVRSIDLAGVIDDVVASAQPASDAKEIRLSVSLDPSIGMVQGDPARLQQVIWNLLSNAIKFTQKQGRVEVVLRRIDSEVDIAISDNGPGIKSEFIPHVFDRFRQQDGSSSRKFNGLGLGLSIAKQIVELHGGRIQAASEGEGRGATFSVQLPVAVTYVGEATSNNEEPVAIAEFDPVLDSVHVLLVEDEPDARDLVLRILEDRGARVTAVANAADAIAAFIERKPDVIVSDIGLPGEDGYAFMRRLRAIEGYDGKVTPAAALTALARSDDRRRALLAGFQTHIAKPVDPRELLVVIASLTGRTRSRNGDDSDKRI